MRNPNPIIVYPSEAKLIFGFSDEQIEAADKGDGWLDDHLVLNKKIGELWQKPYSI
jgi:hypothetical protein